MLTKSDNKVPIIVTIFTSTILYSNNKVTSIFECFTSLVHEERFVMTMSNRHYFNIASIVLLIVSFSSFFSFGIVKPNIIPSRQVTIDNVTVTLRSNFISDRQFMLDAHDLSAVISQYHPYEYFSIQAVPYGHSASNELTIPINAGSAPDVTLEFQKSRLSQGAHRIVGANPVAQIFGRTVQGSAYQTSRALYSNTNTPVIITDWITEAGKRLWIIHTVQEQSHDISAITVLKQLDTPIITSTTLNHTSTMLSTGNSIPKQPLLIHSANVATVPYPSWWNGNCDVNNHSGAYAYAIWNGLEACGPGETQGGFDTPTSFFSGAWGELEFECIELSMRYMYLEYQIHPYPANGRDAFYGYGNSNYQAYNGSSWVTYDFYNYNSSSAGNLLQKIYNGTPGQVPQAGDVMSYGASEQYGHTNIVTSSNVDANGNGTVYTIDQNSAMTSSVSVTNWNVYNAIGWLHAGNSNHSTQTIGLYLPGPTGTPSTYYLKNSLSGGVADETIFYGNAPMMPVVGNWNGNSQGIDYIGAYDPTTSTFYLATSNSPSATATYTISYGNAGGGYTPLAGHWTP